MLDLFERWIVSASSRKAVMICILVSLSDERRQYIAIHIIQEGGLAEKFILFLLFIYF